MRTRKQAAADRRELMKSNEKEHRRKERAKVKGLGAELRAIHARQAAALRETSTHCRAERHALAEKRKATLAALREALRVERAAARETCALRKEKARANLTDKIARAKEELAAERKYQADLRRIERGNRATSRGGARASAAERRSESDDEVRANLSPELLGLFEKVKRGIKGSARQSRTEAFLAYAEAHPREVLASLDERTEAVVRDLERRQRAAPAPERKARPMPRRATPRPQYTVAELADVPF